MMKKSHISYFLLTLFVLSSGLQAQCPKCGHELSKEAPAAVTPLESLDIASSDSNGLTDGVYVGATLGVNMDVSKQQFQFNYDGNIYEFRAKSKAFSFLFGGNFGYLRVFKDTFMGIEVGYLGPQTAVKQTGQVAYDVGDTAHFHTKHHQDFSVHLVQKFGWLLSARTGVYVKAGPVFTQFTFKGKITGHPRAPGGGPPPVVTGAWVSHQEKRLGVDLGIGVLHDLGEGWMMAFDCSHRRFQKIKYDFEPGIGSFTEIKLTPKQTMAMLTFAYTF